MKVLRVLGPQGPFLRHNIVTEVRSGVVDDGDYDIFFSLLDKGFIKKLDNQRA